MIWIYISPHFDDVALSCGGLVWEQSRAGNEVSIWTICAGKPQQLVYTSIVKELHARWKSGDQAVDMRKQEDIKSCQSLNASYHHFDVPDCIYRLDGKSNPLYSTDERLSGPIDPYDAFIIDRLAEELVGLIPPEAQIVCPLAIGNHIDHQLTRQIIQKTGKAAWFYADYPYVLENQEAIAHLKHESWVSKIFPITKNGFQAWLKSVSAHQSQLSTFWDDFQEMESDFREYLQNNQGIALWHLDRNG